MYNQKKDNNKFKNKNNQNFQKIELYGSQTTKELKKKHSPRPAGGAETGSWVERTHSEAVAGGAGVATAGRLGVPHPHADKLGGITGERDRPATQGYSREMKPQNL